jgi:hypothetical protein
LLQSSASPRPGLSEALIKPLGKNPPRAAFIAAAEATDLELNPNPPPMSGEIVQAAFIPAVDLRRHSPTQRTGRGSRWRPRDGNNRIASARDILDD